MAARSISTKIAIEGEAQYKAAIASINTELKSMQSSLRLTESEFQNQQNTTTALQSKLEALNKVYESQKSKVETLQKALDNAKSAQQTWADKVETAKQKLENATKAQDQYTKAGGNNKTVLDQLAQAEENARKELSQAQAGYEAATRGVNNWQNQLNNATIAANDTNASIENTKKYLDEARNSTDGCAKSINEFGERLDNSKSKADEFAEALTASGVQDALTKVTDAIKECVTAYASFEEAMAGVMRTTGMSSEEIEVLGSDFEDMSTYMPITAEELANIAMTAGQLGIANENIESFTTVMGELATTTDLTADNAATLLAQFANITQMDPGDYERLGSTLAALGDSSATTASKVAEMANGIAASGSLAGMSEREILAIATAVGSVGVEAGTGSTAISTFINNVTKAVQGGGDSLEKFAEVAGMTAGEFKAAWENDAAGTFETLIEKIGESENATSLLSDLGITAARQTKVILSLASAGDTLANSFQLADEAWEENTALGEKADIMWSTLSAEMTEAKNAFANLKVGIGESVAPLLEPFISGFTDATSALTKFVDEHPGVTAACTAIAAGIGTVTAALVGLSAASKTAGILGFTGLAAKLSGAATAISGAFADAGAAISLFFEALGAGSASLGVGLGGLAAFVGYLGANVAYTSYDNANIGTAGYTGSKYSNQQLVDGDSDPYTNYEQILAQYQDLTQKHADFQRELDDMMNGVTEFDADRYDYLTSQLTSLENQITATELALPNAASDVNWNSVNKKDSGTSSSVTKPTAADSPVANLGASNSSGLGTRGDTLLDTAFENGGTNSFEDEEAVINDCTIALEEYAEAWQTAYDAAYDNIHSIVGLFGELTESEEILNIAQQNNGVISDTMIEKWHAQADSVNAYNDNLQTLIDAGLATELVAQLSDGSEESVAYVDALAQEISGLDDEQTTNVVTELNNAYTAAEDAQEELSSATADMEADTDGITSYVESELGSLPSGMYSTGVAICSNISSGLSSGSGALYAKVQSIVQTAIAKAESAAGSGGSSGGSSDGTSGGGVTSTKKAASGTASASPGLYLVGENGPELLMMHGGEQVIDAVHTAALKNQIATENLLNGAAKSTSGSSDSRIIKVLNTYLPQLLEKDNNMYFDSTVVSKTLAPSMDAALGRRKRLA